ncbi:hypothetical protein [Bacillus toyonensis]|uniref:Cap15 family cyclic dinucleotide receptor domain-containing protein n=1 Tax=Bacillus toyonensis TaxID=155322 RepID=UPI000B449718|nr:hypothetical protein [Bacillus toyonensis]OTX39834.1 hypothetical protein BK717_07220 [Bacillus thuringiensis serovar malayensis]OUB01673.1 hypothetical protein BK709_30230 [Bacillus thuringiensis serovar shandongiensis]MBH0359275.1 hypothetical protein [Bacillus toyonensis biovar Thuringiensis]MBX0355325.1 hypothetical protein [Bacillus toyonensis]WIG29997.1 hypothetical protein QPL81_15225 [Bacillus toyonensis]
MHDYIVLESKKKSVIFSLAVFSYILSNAITALLNSWGVVGVTITCSLLFAINYFLFNKYIWKFKICKKILCIPDLNGEWKCVGLSNNIDLQQQFDWTAEIKIIQTWDKICISMENGSSSKSKSITAAIKHFEGVGYQLSYNYENKPEVSADSDMRKHDGFCVLTFNEDNKKAEGYYFNNIQDRKSYGQMNLERVK